MSTTTSSNEHNKTDKDLERGDATSNGDNDEEASDHNMESIHFTGNNNNDNNNNVDESSSTSSSSSSLTSGALWTLRVMSFQSVEIHVPPNCDVTTVKMAIRQTLDVSKDRTMRLICKGRLLAPDTAFLSEFRVENGDVLHAVIAAASTNSSGATDTVMNSNSSANGGGRHTTSRRRRRNHRHGRRHQIVGPGGRVTRANPDDDPDGGTSSSDDDDSYYDEEDGRPRIGLDRLLRVNNNNNHNTNGGGNRRNNNNNNNTNGLSRQDVAVLRTYFSRQIDRHALMNNSHSDEPDLRRRRLLVEEDWMAAQGPTSEFRLNLNSSLFLMNSINGRSNNDNNAFLRSALNGNNNNATNDFAFRSGSSSTVVGTDRDFMWGFLLGFFVGFVMLVWVWMPTVPHKQKLGILTGISFQLAMNVLQEGGNDGNDYMDGMEEPDQFETTTTLGSNSGGHTIHGN